MKKKKEQDEFDRKADEMYGSMRSGLRAVNKDIKTSINRTPVMQTFLSTPLKKKSAFSSKGYF